MLALTALMGGSLAWLIAPLRSAWRLASSEPAWLRERRAWRRLIAPLIIVVLGTAILFGWALQEPEDSDERLALFAWVLVGLVLLLWARALARLVRSLAARSALPIAVVGLVRPRVVLDPRLPKLLDADAFAAALAHEAAHLRHRDPLRIVLAQLATDLQWPWPQPQRRFTAWRELLEDARDDEAIADGIAPADLAAAIVEVARWATQGAGSSLADRHPIELRIHRLLDGQPRERPDPSAGFAMLLASSVAALTGVGFAIGDDLLMLLPGVLR
jgi:hypothetical protein